MDKEKALLFRGSKPTLSATNGQLDMTQWSTSLNLAGMLSWDNVETLARFARVTALVGVIAMPHKPATMVLRLDPERLARASTGLPPATEEQVSVGSLRDLYAFSADEDRAFAAEGIGEYFSALDLEDAIG